MLTVCGYALIAAGLALIAWELRRIGRGVVRAWRRAGGG